LNAQHRTSNGKRRRTQRHFSAFSVLLREIDLQSHAGASVHSSRWGAKAACLIKQENKNKNDLVPSFDVGRSMFGVHLWQMSQAFRDHEKKLSQKARLAAF
jgi:hypothetical protein